MSSSPSRNRDRNSSHSSSSGVSVFSQDSSVVSGSFNFPLDSRLSTLLATLDYDSTEEAFQDQGYKHGFRVLVMGRRNAGKTTLLKRMTDSFDGEVEIRDPNGNLVDPSIINPSVERGNSAIENEIRYPSNRAYVFHDSRGAEAGSLEEPELVREFIKKRQSMNLDDRIHVIWYCLPVDSDRPLLEDELSFFNFEELKGIPIVAIFTKFEGRINKAFSALKEEGLPLRQAKLGAKSKAVADFRHVIADRKLGSFRHPPGAHVFLQELDKGGNCEDLTKATYDIINDDILKKRFREVQRLRIRVAVSRALIYAMWTAKTHSPKASSNIDNRLDDWVAFMLCGFPSWDVRINDIFHSRTNAQ
ncbi:hypothetical protein VKT23_009367 [Stygiomarasmius scandens]|uniref:G domain-containing protein n=1 Tax=Marasmiellus scandens TaxID=2682957 RepID=A0ABR1JKH8_9AGAR